MTRDLAVLVVTSALLAPAVTAGQAQKYEFSQTHMGTLVRIVLYAPGPAAASDAASAAFTRIAALDEALSDYRDSSELTRLARRAGDGPVHVSEDLFRVLRAAQAIGRASDGAFDVTAGPLSVLWRRARRQQELPAAADLAAARTLVGLDKLQLDAARRTVRLRQPRMQLDLGGIAKGFAADEAAAVLAGCGVRSALIAAGGDIVAMDAPPDRASWRVAVASIDGAAGPPLGYVALKNGAVSSSGDAEQFAAVAGVRYSHIFDPRTGQALTGRRSVTVVAKNGTTADALATAVSVMGPDPGLRLVDATLGAAAVISSDAGDGRRTRESSRWRGVSGFTSSDR